jgi:hypothetical protein
LSDELARCQKLGALKRSGRCKKGHRRRELELLQDGKSERRWEKEKLR